MTTLRIFSSVPESIPATTSWYLADIAESRGRQELFTKQSPQKLKVLREHAIIESAVSSNRIEGVEIDRKRVGTVIFGKPLLRDRNEEEVAGYRNALKLIHEKPAGIKISGETIRKLHRLSRGEIWDAGKYKEKDGDIIEKYPDGRERVRFKTVPAAGTPAAMAELVSLWHGCLKEKWAHPLLGLAAFNLDFLCIHPFRDGNGRVSRLLLLLQAYHLGFEVGRYISIERLIEEHKDRYYETLEQSSQGWHEGKNDPWPFVNFTLFILKTAYREFERRVGETKSPRGAKTALVESIITAFTSEFTLAEVEKACPGVSRDMIRRVLRKAKADGKVRCLGFGPGAIWRKEGITSKRG
jgi:Fic family protein